MKMGLKNRILLSDTDRTDLESYRSIATLKKQKVWIRPRPMDAVLKQKSKESHEILHDVLYAYKKMIQEKNMHR